MNSWNGIRASAQQQLTQRSYQTNTLAHRVASGIDAGELADADRTQPEVDAIWIPGVEIFRRAIFAQRQRGFFGELAREEDGVLARIGMWPRQWATARMFAGTAKGFHIHPPHIPEGEEEEAWFRRVFIEHPADNSLRPYECEQWDAMFFVQGGAEMVLVDERAGLDRRVMRFFIDGDDRRGAANVGVVIPAGVAHAIRVEGSADLIMVYGTSTKFDPAAEGRIASDVEAAPLPDCWSDYIAG